jgi:hypothetical protein
MSPRRERPILDGVWPSGGPHAEAIPTCDVAEPPPARNMRWGPFAHPRISLANTGVGAARSRQTGTHPTLYTSRQKLPNEIMSAHGDDETVRRATLHEAVGFLHKPFVEDVLLDSILLATGRKGEVN